MSKAYCGIGKIPKTQRKGTMKECAEKKQVRLYGLYKIDPQLVNPKAKLTPKDKKIGKNDIRALIFKFKGRFQRLKTELEEAREKDIIIRRELAKALTAYEKSAPGNKDNPAKFNQGIYEILKLPRLNPDGSIERDVNGEPIYIETASFVQKYDLIAFKKCGGKLFKVIEYPRLHNSVSILNVNV